MVRQTDVGTVVESLTDCFVLRLSSSSAVMTVVGPAILNEDENGCPNCGIPVFQAEALLAGRNNNKN